MKTIRIALVIGFVLSCVYETKQVGQASRAGVLNEGSAKPMAGDAPAFLDPLKPVYVTTPGDAFILLVSAECRSGEPDSTTFELAPPTPAFVHLGSPGCVGKTGFTTGVISVTPGNEDRGTHFARVIARPCGGGPATEFVLKIKVKKS